MAVRDEDVPERIVYFPNADVMGECAGIRRGNARVRLRLEQLGSVLLSYESSHYGPQNREFAKMGATVIPDPMLAAEGSVVMGSPHGSSEETKEAYRRRGVIFEDLECPLVTFPKKEAREYVGECLEKGLVPHLEYIGHSGHRETEEFLKDFRGWVHLIQTEEDIKAHELEGVKTIFVAWQTTLADVSPIISTLEERYPGRIRLPRVDYRCFATRNRQNWSGRQINEIQVDLTVVVTDKKSSNGMRLVEASENHQPPLQVLAVTTAKELRGIDFREFNRIGVNAAASVPVPRVMEVVDHFGSLGYSKKEVFVAKEPSLFRDPPVYDWRTSVD